MDIQTISTKQLRQDFSQVLSAMEQGQSLMLLYRSKPLAQIKPIKKPALRSFTSKKLKQWITDDKLTSTQQAKIDEIINRLS